MKLFNITTDGKFVHYAEHDFKEKNYEEKLEFWLENNPRYIMEDEDVLIIGRQVTTNLGSVIDLLGIDVEGNLVVMELKRDRTPRETLAQILEYASFAEALTYDQLEDIFLTYSGEENLVLTDYHRNHFQLDEGSPVAFNKHQKLVIIGQNITKEIKQTSAFLRKKGIDVYCLEFKYFETKSKEQIISTEFVIGNDIPTTQKVSSGALPKINKKTFLSSLDQHGKNFFEPLLEFSSNNKLPIHWGSKGFSINVDLAGNHVNIMYGYPPHSVYKQTVYTATAEISRKVNDAEPIVDHYRQGLDALGIFKPAGAELKCLISHDISKETREGFFDLLLSVVEMIRANGIIE